jgi:hypothetical protein
MTLKKAAFTVDSSSKFDEGGIIRGAHNSSDGMLYKGRHTSRSGLVHRSTGPNIGYRPAPGLIKLFSKTGTGRRRIIKLLIIGHMWRLCTVGWMVAGSLSMEPAMDHEAMESEGFEGRRKEKLSQVQGIKDTTSVMALLDFMEAVGVLGGWISEAGVLEGVTDRTIFRQGMLIIISCQCHLERWGECALARQLAR